MRQSENLAQELARQIVIELDIAREYLDTGNLPAVRQRLDDIEELQAQYGELVASNRKASEDHLREILGT